MMSKKTKSIAPKAAPQATMPRTTAALLTALNHYTRPAALGKGAPRSLKLWVSPAVLGRELLARLNEKSDKQIARQSRDVTRPTLQRRQQKAAAQNRARVQVYVRDLKNRQLLFLRVNSPCIKNNDARRSAAKGRREIAFMVETGLIATARDARYFGPSLTGSPHTYVAVAADKLQSLSGLKAQAAAFDRQVRIEQALTKLGDTAPATPPPPQKLRAAFDSAAAGLHDEAERTMLRRAFEQAVTERYGNQTALRFNANTAPTPKQS